MTRRGKLYDLNASGTGAFSTSFTVEQSIHDQVCIEITPKGNKDKYLHQRVADNAYQPSIETNPRIFMIRRFYPVGDLFRELAPVRCLYNFLSTN